MLSDMDINAIAGTLKLYFRELPEPLLTDRLYPAFMEGIGEQRQGSEGWAEPGLPDQLFNTLKITLAKILPLLEQRHPENDIC